MNVRNYFPQSQNKDDGNYSLKKIHKKVPIYLVEESHVLVYS